MDITASSSTASSITYRGEGNKDVEAQKNGDTVKALEVPKYWKVHYYCPMDSSGNRICNWKCSLETILFQSLCLIAFGKAEATAVWRDINDPEGLKTIKEHLADQVSNTNIMAGLLLATAAVFLTTGTPRQDMLSFTSSAPYACLQFSFGVAMGGMLGGCSLQLVSGRCSSDFLRYITRTRFRLYMTLLLMAYPLFAVIVACNVCAVGLLIASLDSQHIYVKVLACLLIALPWSLFLIFAWLSISSPPAESASQSGRKELKE